VDVAAMLADPAMQALRLGPGATAPLAIHQHGYLEYLEARARRFALHVTAQAAARAAAQNDQAALMAALVAAVQNKTALIAGIDDLRALLATHRAEVTQLHGEISAAEAELQAARAVLGEEVRNLLAAGTMALQDVLDCPTVAAKNNTVITLTGAKQARGYEAPASFLIAGLPQVAAGLPYVAPSVQRSALNTRSTRQPNPTAGQGAGAVHAHLSDRGAAGGDPGPAGAAGRRERAHRGDPGGSAGAGRGEHQPELSDSAGHRRRSSCWRGSDGRSADGDGNDWVEGTMRRAPAAGGPLPARGAAL